MSILRPFHMFGRLVALSNLYAVAEAAHVILGCGSTLARVKALGIEDDIDFAIDFHDVALAKGAGNHFHDACSLIMAAGNAAFSVVGPHHTDLRALRQRFSQAGEMNY